MRVAVRRDFLQRALDAHDLSALVTHSIRQRPHPGAPALFGHDLHLLVERNALAGASGEQGLHLVAPLRGIEAECFFGRWRESGAATVQRGKLVGPDQALPLQIDHPDAHECRPLNEFQKRVCLLELGWIHGCGTIGKERSKPEAAIH